MSVDSVTIDEEKFGSEDKRKRIIVLKWDILNPDESLDQQTSRLAVIDLNEYLSKGNSRIGEINYASRSWIDLSNGQTRKFDEHVGIFDFPKRGFDDLFELYSDRGILARVWEDIQNMYQASSKMSR